MLEARPIHQARIAGKPARIDRLHSGTQSARGFANGTGAARRIDKTGHERQSRARHSPPGPGVARHTWRRVGRFIAPGRPPPALRAETSRARGRCARRRLFPPPSAEGAATPPAPDAVSLRRPGFEQADEVLCLRPQPRALLQPRGRTPGATEPASAPDVSVLA